LELSRSFTALRAVVAVYVLVVTTRYLMGSRRPLRLGSSGVTSSTRNPVLLSRTPSVIDWVAHPANFHWAWRLGLWKSKASGWILLHDRVRNVLSKFPSPSTWILSESLYLGWWIKRFTVGLAHATTGREAPRGTRIPRSIAKMLKAML
jgi:hypothetical protein